MGDILSEVSEILKSKGFTVYPDPKIQRNGVVSYADFLCQLEDGRRLIVEVKTSRMISRPIIAKLLQQRKVLSGSVAWLVIPKDARIEPSAMELAKRLWVNIARVDKFKQMDIEDLLHSARPIDIEILEQQNFDRLTIQQIITQYLGPSQVLIVDLGSRFSGELKSLVNDLPADFHYIRYDFDDNALRELASYKESPSEFEKAHEEFLNTLKMELGTQVRFAEHGTFFGISKVFIVCKGEHKPQKDDKLICPAEILKKWMKDYLGIK